MNPSKGKIECCICRLWKPSANMIKSDTVKEILDVRYPFICQQCYNEVKDYILNFMWYSDGKQKAKVDDIYPSLRLKYGVVEGREEQFMRLFNI